MYDPDVVHELIDVCNEIPSPKIAEIIGRLKPIVAAKQAVITIGSSKSLSVVFLTVNQVCFKLSPDQARELSVKLKRNSYIADGVV